VNELRRDSVRTSSKGLRDEGVKVALLRSVSVNLAELRRVFKMKALLRSVSVNLAELSPSPRLRRTRRRVFKVKNFWFMDEIVTGGVGHLEG
jgi:hypothetical protein